MINQLRGIHAGATISIVGSSPTAKSFCPKECDVSIGVNGAALLGPYFNYFLCMTRDAAEHDWFDRDCSRSRIIGSKIATLDYRLYPATFDATLGQRKLYIEEPDLPEPARPHFIFAARSPTEQGVEALLERRAEALMTHGTTAGQAVQLAFLMGASCIQLYGCSFSADTSGKPGHYFYDAPQQQTGWISTDQIHFMELYLSLVRREGAKVVVHGESALRQF